MVLSNFEIWGRGLTWAVSLTSTSVSSANPFPITLTSLNSTKMLLAFSTYEGGALYYRIFDGVYWGSLMTISGIMMQNTVKQISSDSDAYHNAYIAFPSGGNSGSLELSKWSNIGFYLSTEIANRTLSHSLPSITITPDSYIHIYSVSGSRIYETTRSFNATIWENSYQIFDIGMGTTSLLTAVADRPGVMWAEGASSPFNIYSLIDPLDPTNLNLNVIEYEYHDSSTGGSYGMRGNILISSPTAFCNDVQPYCLFEGIAVFYDGISGDGHSNSGSVAAGFIKWHLGSKREHIVFFYNDINKKFRTIKLVKEITNYGLPAAFYFDVHKTTSDDTSTQWQRYAYSYSNGQKTLIKSDVVTFKTFKVGYPRIAAWTKDAKSELGFYSNGSPQPAYFYSLETKVRTTQQWARAATDAVGYICESDNPYWIHDHVDGTAHMTPPRPTTEQNSCPAGSYLGPIWSFG